jgi:hypothetical protein
LLGLNITALAQDSRSIVVNVPFEVVAGAKVLPAGTYSVERISPDTNSALVIRGYGYSALLLPTVVDRVSSGQANVKVIV